MNDTPELISHYLCPYVQRAVIVLTEKSVEHTRTYIDLSAKPDWFQKVSPLGKTPVLTHQGVVVFESQVIAEYLDEVTEGTLHPFDALEKAKHRSWIEYASATLNDIAGLYNAPTERDYLAKAESLKQKFSRLQGEIVGPWFGGDTFHMIDGVWGTVFRYFDVIEELDGSDFGLSAPGLNDWRDRVARKPSVKGAVPVDYKERLLEFLVRRPSHLGAIAAALTGSKTS